MKKTALSLLIALSCLLVSLICPFSAHAESADKALVVYFSRMGNTENIESVDAVSSASFLVRDGALAGNAQTIAGWIADAIEDFDGRRDAIAAGVAELCEKFPIYR